MKDSPTTTVFLLPVKSILADPTACILDMDDYRTEGIVLLSAPLRVLQGVLLVMLCLMTYAGNFFLWVTVLSFKDLRKGFFILLLNLSVSDLLLAAVNMPLMAYALLAGRWNADCTLCRISSCTFILGITTSTVSLLSVSINRYIRVCREPWHRMLYSARCLVLHIAAIWLVSISVSASRGLLWNQIQYQPYVHYCFAKDGPLYATLLILMPNIIAWPFILLCTSSVYTHYKDVVSRAEIIHLPRGKSQSSRQRRISRRLSVPPRLPSIPEVPESTECSVASPRSVASVEDLEKSTQSMMLSDTMTFYELPFTDHTASRPDKLSPGLLNRNNNSTHKVLARRHDLALALPFKLHREQTGKGRSVSTSAHIKKDTAFIKPVSRNKSSKRMSPAKAKTADFHVTTLLATMLVGSCLLFLPVSMIFLFEDHVNIPPFVHTLGLILMYVHSTCHPFIYWWTSPDLRERFLQQFCFSGVGD